jgi:hypothetical protein
VRRIFKLQFVLCVCRKFVLYRNLYSVAICTLPQFVLCRNSSDGEKNKPDVTCNAQFGGSSTGLTRFPFPFVLRVFLYFASSIPTNRQRKKCMQLIWLKRSIITATLALLGYATYYVQCLYMKNTRKQYKAQKIGP